MKKPLVTVLTPCYNGEEYIERFIDSILNQTYPNIELIIVNDGSIDNTENIILKNKKKIENKRYLFKYFYQDNKGQATAINFGLKHVTGDYLTWPDSDDFLEPSSIEEKVEFLQKNIEYGAVRTSVNVVNEKNIKKILYVMKSNSKKTNIFNDVLLEKTYLANGAYLLRMRYFLDVNPKRKIYPSRAGQNWQMLLPILYKYKCGYIDKPLCTYVIRNNSHSHDLTDDFSKELSRLEQHKDILITVIKNINSDYLKIVENKYIKKELYLGIKFKRKNFSKIRYQKLKKIKQLSFKDKVYYYFKDSIITKIINKIY